MKISMKMMTMKMMTESYGNQGINRWTVTVDGICCTSHAVSHLSRAPIEVCFPHWHSGTTCPGASQSTCQLCDICGISIFSAETSTDPHLLAGTCSGACHISTTDVENIIGNSLQYSMSVYIGGSSQFAADR